MQTANILHELKKITQKKKKKTKKTLLQTLI